MHNFSKHLINSNIEIQLVGTEVLKLPFCWFSPFEVCPLQFTCREGSPRGFPSLQNWHNNFDSTFLILSVEFHGISVISVSKLKFEGTNPHKNSSMVAQELKFDPIGILRTYIPLLRVSRYAGCSDRVKVYLDCSKFR